MRFNVIALIVMLSIVLPAASILPNLVPVEAFAQDTREALPKADATDKIIASTLKLLATTYVRTVDLDNLKQKNIKRIAKKDPEKLNRELLRLHETIQGTPVEEMLKITPNSSMEVVIARIRSLTKEELHSMIESMPDYTIGKKVKDYFTKRNKEVSGEKKNIVLDVKALWKDIITRANPEEN
ncbi:hypothetical protein ACFL38_00250 [Candidatus Omnitrophota bacterium]